MIQFFVDGKPKSTQLGSSFRIPGKNGKKDRWMQKPLNTEWSDDFASIVRQHRQDPLLSGPVEITFRFYLAKPQKPKCCYPASRPDWDNLIKKLSDRMNGVIWEDDKLIVAAHVYKLYHAEGRVGVEVTVEELAIPQAVKAVRTRPALSLPGIQEVQHEW